LAACGEALDVETRDYSVDLVPIAARVLPVTGSATPGIPRYRGTNSFLFRPAQAGRSVLKVRPGFVRTASVTYRLLPGDGMGDVLATGSFEGSDPLDVAVDTPKIALYRIEFPTGGSAAQIDFGAIPSVWELRPGAGGHVIGSSGQQYVYVPKGTKSLAVGLATPDGHGEVVIQNPQGEVALQRAGNFATGEEFAVPVPEGKDGAVWSFRVGRCEDAAGIILIGVPPYASPRPQTLLVPREALSE
jgi:hypothetical protein